MRLDFDKDASGVFMVSKSINLTASCNSEEELSGQVQALVANIHNIERKMLSEIRNRKKK